MRGIFTGVKPKSAHEEMEHERLIKETIKHHQEGTATKMYSSDESNQAPPGVFFVGAPSGTYIQRGPAD